MEIDLKNQGNQRNHLVSIAVILTIILIILSLYYTLSFNSSNNQPDYQLNNQNVDTSEIFPKNKVHFYFLNVNKVGSGNCFLILSKNKKVIMIDSGKFAAYRKVILPFLNKHQITTINQIWLSHQHPDHVGGFIELMKDKKINILKIFLYDPYPVELVAPIETWVNYDYQTEYEQILKDHVNRLVKLKTGQSHHIDDILIEVLSAKNPHLRLVNNSSVVQKISYKKVSFLFTGDAGFEQEEHMLNKYQHRAAAFKSNVVQVAHHGIKGLSTKFYSLVEPQIAIFPTPLKWIKNKDLQNYIQYFKKRKTQVYITGIDENIHLVTDGKTLKVLSF